MKTTVVQYRFFGSLQIKISLQRVFLQNFQDRYFAKDRLLTASDKNKNSHKN